MIHHVTLEIVDRLKSQELDFWRAVGYVRLQRTRQMGKTEWLREELVDARGGPVSHVQLVAVKSPATEFGLGGVALTCPRGLDVAMESLDRLPFKVEATWLEEYWGAKRLLVVSPSGHRVQLMEYAPGATWTTAPRDF